MVYLQYFIRPVFAPIFFWPKPVFTQSSIFSPSPYFYGYKYDDPNLMIHFSTIFAIFLPVFNIFHPSMAGPWLMASGFPQDCPERCRTFCCTLESTGDLVAVLPERLGGSGGLWPNGPLNLSSQQEVQHDSKSRVFSLRFFFPKHFMRV